MLALALACGHEETAPPWPLPRVVAESEYIDGELGFYKAFTIDAPVKGLYEMSLMGPADTLDQSAGYMVSCPGVEPGSVSSIRGSSSKGILYPGRHRIGVNFPHAPEPAGELSLTLRYEAPP